ncbi:MAG: hypothetical protein E7317_04090 [Clostridiales bacterium]|nr:hypothetical protein [Clostridiales bacterium]
MGMTSAKFLVNNESERAAAAHYATEDFARKLELGRHETLKLDLLVEETLGMVNAMLEDFYGQIWFTGEGRACEIHFEVTADMDAAKKRELLTVSTTGRNAAKKGFMARIGEMIAEKLYAFGRTMNAYGEENARYGIVHTPESTALNADMMPIWTLSSYRAELDEARFRDDDAEEAWDELEKSIVATLADEITVSVRGDRIDLVIKKTF